MGGNLVKPRNCSKGSCGASRLAKIAIKMTIDTTVRPRTAPLFSRKERQNARSRPGGFCGRAAVDGNVTSTGMADPRIDETVSEIDDQVDHDDDARDEHDAALEGWIVTPADRFD